MKTIYDKNGNMKKKVSQQLQLTINALRGLKSMNDKKWEKISISHHVCLVEGKELFFIGKLHACLMGHEPMTLPSS